MQLYIQQTRLLHRRSNKKKRILLGNYWSVLQVLNNKSKAKYGIAVNGSSTVFTRNANILQFSTEKRAKLLKTHREDQQSDKDSDLLFYNKPN
jgi:hypothetical protein